MRYEYKVLSQPLPVVMRERDIEKTALQLEQILNRLGAEGWKFVTWEHGVILLQREVL